MRARQAAHGTSRAGAFCRAGRESHQRGVPRVHVGVVGEHVAGAVVAARAVERAALFGRGDRAGTRAGVVHADRRIVGAVDGDRQHRRVGKTAVADRIVELSVSGMRPTLSACTAESFSLTT